MVAVAGHLPFRLDEMSGSDWLNEQAVGSLQFFGALTTRYQRCADRATDRNTATWFFRS